MLQESDFLNFQQFEQQLQSLLAAEGLSMPELKAEIVKLQQAFQTQLIEPSESRNDVNQLQSIQIEINKQLRLLDTDLLFLQAARQPITIQQRRQQMADRLKLLQRYCSAILEADTEGENL